MVKTQDLFSDMQCDPSNQTTLPALHFFGRFSSKQVNLAQISSTESFTGVTPTIKIIRAGYEKIFFCTFISFYISVR